MTSNLSVLTKSHQIVAAKKRAKRQQLKEIVFDDVARSEFLTGFHKRKLQKKEAAIQKAKEREKQERLEARREKRQMLAERAVENAAEIERAYGAVVDEEADDEQWGGIDQASGSGSRSRDAEQEEEYEHEEELATVTIVEDFDPDALIHGPKKQQSSLSNQDSELAQSTLPLTASVQTALSDRRKAKSKVKDKAETTKAKTQTKVVKKAKDIKYQTNAARKAERLKQRRRKVEKAERAGGKASRSRRGEKK